jgi:hypothetical protein
MFGKGEVVVKPTTRPKGSSICRRLVATEKTPFVLARDGKK